MTKENILFDRLGVYSYRLKTQTLKTEGGKITTYYTVIWSMKYGESSEIKQEISKEEYEYLLKELKEN